MAGGLLVLRGLVALGDEFDLQQEQPRAPAETLDALYRSYWPDLCGRLRHAFGAGPPDPEDAAQAAFMRFAALPDRDQVINPRAFIWRSAVNFTIDYKRRDRHRFEYVRHYRTAGSFADIDTVSPEEEVIELERLNLLRNAIGQMAEKPRTVLTLHCFKGYTYQQICDQTGWSYGDVYRQMVTALEVLSASLKPLR